MKYGVREICEVVLKAKGTQKVGKKIFYKDEPVLYFDTLKTSSMEGTAETVYATGGVGNTRLMAWEGERTVTFTMEDALISPVSFMILSGAGLIEADETHKIMVHTTEQTDEVFVTDSNEVYIALSEKAYLNDKENFAYVMLLNNGEVVSEPYIPETKLYVIDIGEDNQLVFSEASDEDTETHAYTNVIKLKTTDNLVEGATAWTEIFKNGEAVLVDYYVERDSGVSQIEITPDKFGGNYYLEASTLWRGTDGIDVPAEFIIPNCKIQSNFTFTMASTGDPSTFTFTMDAFPDYTRFNEDKKVLAAIQVIGTDASGVATDYRAKTAHDYSGSGSE